MSDVEKQAIEIIAKAFFADTFKENDMSWEDWPEAHEPSRSRAIAALADLKAAGLSLVPSEGVEVSFNVNDTVKVRLTDEGRRVATDFTRKLYSEYERVTGSIVPDDWKSPRDIEEDQDGWSKWQLWVFMQQVGCEMRNGGKQLIHDNAILFPLPTPEEA